MIRIHRPVQAPLILRHPNYRGPKKTKAMREAFEASPADYQSGEKTFEFDSGAYGAKSVKSTLMEAQHEKCCFCESKIAHISYGDVEHFRPKAGWAQDEGDALGRPGYYWLAYEWSNLFLSCQLCNQRFKKNLFPLENPTDRAESHNDDISVEVALFVKPDEEDPEDFVWFREEYAYAIEDNKYGRRTIDSLQLNREELVERRRDGLGMLKELKMGRDIVAAGIEAGDSDPQLADCVSQVDATLAASVQPAAEYSAMAKALLV